MAAENIDFQRDVLERSHSIPVLVDFWATWCGPCRALAPVLEGLAAKNSSRLALIKVNTEEQPEIAARYGVRSIPNVKLFVDGQVVDEFTGALPESVIQEWLDRSLPSPLRDQLKAAEACLAAGQVEAAAARLQAILKVEPDNGRAAVLLAQLNLPADPQKAIDLVRGVGADSEFFDTAEAIRTLARLFELGDAPERLEESPAKAVYLSAIAHLKSGDFERALSEFIRVVRIARNYDADGGRKACVALFRYLGDDHELTRRYRSELSGALYV